MKQLIGIIVLLSCVTVFTTSCNKEAIVGEGTEQGEANHNEGGGEGNHDEGGEGGNESGTLWSIDQTADETINGIQLILSYDMATQTFIGTLENKNTTTMPQVRVEVHIFDAAGNSTEYGPTAPADMAPGETRNVTLPTPGAGTFVSFNMHPEVG